jgi:hypothetical protein
MALSGPESDTIQPEGQNWEGTLMIGIQEVNGSNLIPQMSVFKPS